MTRREIAALFCKALGLYLFIRALESILLLSAFTSLTFTFLREADDESLALIQSLAHALPAILSFFVALLLWFGANRIAGFMVDEPDETGEPIAASWELHTLVFSALGLWALLQALPRLGQLLANLFIMSQTDPMMQHNFSGSTAPEVIGLMIQIVLGFWLLFGSSGLVKLLRSFRSIGMDKEKSVTG